MPLVQYSLHYHPLLAQMPVKWAMIESVWVKKHIDNLKNVNLHITTNDWYQKTLNIWLTRNFFNVDLPVSIPRMPWDQLQLFFQLTFRKLTHHVGPTLTSMCICLWLVKRCNGKQGSEISKQSFYLANICWKCHDTIVFCHWLCVGKCLHVWDPVQNIDASLLTQ